MMESGNDEEQGAKTPGQALGDLVERMVIAEVEKRCQKPIITIEIMMKETPVPIQMRVEDWSIDIKDDLQHSSFYVKPVGALPYQDKLGKLYWMHPVASKTMPAVEQLPPAPSEEDELNDHEKNPDYHDLEVPDFE